MAKRKAILFIYRIAEQALEEREYYVIAWLGPGQNLPFEPASLSYNVGNLRKNLLINIENTSSKEFSLENVRKIGDDLRIKLGLNELLTTIRKNKGYEITILTNDVEIPWEWIYFNEDSQFLCEAFSYGKTFVDGMNAISPLPQPEPIKRIEDQLRDSMALILFDSGGKRGLKKLSNVEEEVKKMEKLFAKFGITNLRSIDGNDKHAEDRFVESIRNEHLKIIHYAGHIQNSALHMCSGEIECKEIESATADRKMSAPLVFLNGCISGNIFDEWNQQKNLSTSFLSAGAAGCICTRRNITDESATNFAQQFYETLLSKDDNPATSIGSVLQMTRQKFKRSHPNSDLSWLLYTLHGSPSYELFPIIGTGAMLREIPNKESVDEISKFTV